MTVGVRVKPGLLLNITGVVDDMALLDVLTKEELIELKKSLI